MSVGATVMSWSIKFFLSDTLQELKKHGREIRDGVVFSQYSRIKKFREWPQCFLL